MSQKSFLLLIVFELYPANRYLPEGTLLPLISGCADILKAFTVRHDDILTSLFKAIRFKGYNNIGI